MSLGDLCGHSSWFCNDPACSYVCLWCRWCNVLWIYGLSIILKEANIMEWCRFLKQQQLDLHAPTRTHRVEMAQEGKSCRLAVGGLPVRSHPGRVEVSLSKMPNHQLLLMSWLVPCMAAIRRWSVCVRVRVRARACVRIACVRVRVCVNEKHQLYRALMKALYKCLPFYTLTHTHTHTHVHTQTHSHTHWP